MKIAEKNDDSKPKSKKKPTVKPKKEQVLIVAQEIKFARLLAGNEKKTRDRALKSLKKWLTNCFQRNYVFKEDDFLRIWKGLFYAVWMADKPLIQEELCDNIASLLDLFPCDQLEHALLLVKTGFKVLATEWYGIDQHRIDKCLMLVRRYLRGSLRCLERCKWSVDSCKMYARMMSSKDGLLCVKTPLYARNATSLILHIIDCFLEELAKVSNGDIPLDSLSELLRPFCSLMCHGQSQPVCTASRRLFTDLIRQSDQGLEYRERTRAWKQMGCPEGGPDALEPASDDDDDGDEQNGDGQPDDDGYPHPLDPRAGRVDVVLANLPVPSRQLASMLRDMIAKTSSKAHRRAKICLERLEKLSASEYPLRMSPPPPRVSSPPPRPSTAAKALIRVDDTLLAASDELALRGLSRKRRKRLLAKSRAGLSIIEEFSTENGLSTDSNNGDWTIEDEPEKKKSKDTSNKENIRKNKKRKIEKQTDNTSTKKKKIELNNGTGKKEIKKEKIKKVKNSVAATKNAPTIIKDTKIQKPEQQKHVEKSETQNNKADKLETSQKPKLQIKKPKPEKLKQNPTVVAKKVKNFQKQLSPKTERSEKNLSLSTPKKVKFVLKNNSMQGAMDYYKSVRQSPNIPFDSSRKPVKTNLKVSTPSPINPFFKKKLKLKN